MLLVGTDNTACGLEAGMSALAQGATAEDAVEIVLRQVEDLLTDSSVGWAGAPNIAGEAELDALIMEGARLHAGAVGALAGYRHPISVARHVMERLPHVMLVGSGAARFATEVGAEPAPPLPQVTRDAYMAQLAEMELDPANLESPGTALIDAVWQAARHRTGGTANVIAQDRTGHLCVGVTTSGWAFKYPGRLGDSPVIGAGGYADDRWGAAACTGMGEITIRLCTAYSIVAGMEAGCSLDEATRAALARAAALSVPLPYTLRLLAVDAQGQVAFWASDPDRAHYWRYRESDAEPQRLKASGPS